MGGNSKLREPTSKLTQGTRALLARARKSSSEREKSTCRTLLMFISSLYAVWFVRHLPYIFTQRRIVMDSQRGGHNGVERFTTGCLDGLP